MSERGSFVNFQSQLYRKILCNHWFFLKTVFHFRSNLIEKTMPFVFNRPDLSREIKTSNAQRDRWYEFMNRIPLSLKGTVWEEDFLPMNSISRIMFISWEKKFFMIHFFSFAEIILITTPSKSSIYTEHMSSILFIDNDAYRTVSHLHHMISIPIRMQLYYTTIGS